MIYAENDAWLKERKNRNFSLAFNGLVDEIADNLFKVNNANCEPLENRDDVFNPYRFGKAKDPDKQDLMDSLKMIGKKVFTVFLSADKEDALICDVSINQLLPLRNQVIELMEKLG